MKRPLSSCRYGVPSAAASDFEETFKRVKPELFAHQPDVLFHLVTMLSPRILQVCRCHVVLSVQPAMRACSFCLVSVLSECGLQLCPCCCQLFEDHTFGTVIGCCCGVGNQNTPSMLCFPVQHVLIPCFTEVAWHRYCVIYVCMLPSHMLHLMW